MADDLDSYLRSLPDRLVGPISRAINEQAQDLSDAQRAALVALEQSPDETGNLEQSCTVVPGKDELEFIVQAGGELTTKEVREGSGVSYDYAEAFEYGTARQPARPFFWPTYREKRAGMQAAINQAIKDALR